MILLKPFFRILILSSFFALFSTSTQAQTNSVPDAVELAVLKNIYDSLGGSTWTINTNWPTLANWPATATAAQMDTWYGITTSNGDITSIAMTNNNLTKQLPATISQLKKLRYLYFGTNKIEGNIPAAFGNLSSLVHLYLSANKITGSIPSTFGSLTNLTRIRMDQNLLTDSIPSSLGNLSQLNELNLKTNQLSGQIPSALGNLSLLEYLYLNNNQLSGAIPNKLALLSKIKFFFVNGNSLSSHIPSGFSGLTMLLSFNVANNNLVEPLPNFSQWSNIIEIDLGFNQMKGDFPASIGNCTTLTKLMAPNNFFTSIPDQVLTLPVNNTLSFTRNVLTRIPAFENHVNKANLYLYVEHNKLDFGQFESLYNKGIKSVTYLIQTNFSDLSFIRVDPNGTLLIPARNAGVNGTVVWERFIEGGSSWVNINSQDQDATKKTFLKTPFTATEDGKFRFKMTNTLFPGSTLTSDPITVRVGPSVIWNEQVGVTESNGILGKTAATG